MKIIVGSVSTALRHEASSNACLSGALCEDDFGGSSDSLIRVDPFGRAGACNDNLES